MFLDLLGFEYTMPAATAAGAKEWWESTPAGIWASAAAYQYSRRPTFAEEWAVTSLMQAHWDLRFNPIAWLGEYFTQRMLALDPGYTRISENAPHDEFYGMIPWAYEWIWMHLIYTWEPVYTFMGAYKL